MERKITTQVCIIGAGTAGMAAAYALKNSKYEVVLIEKHRDLGGTATNAWVETWIEGLVPPYLEGILKEMGVCETDIQKSLLPAKYAREGKGGKNLYLCHSKLSDIYLRDMKKATNIEVLCSYTFHSACIQNRMVKSVHVVNNNDPTDIIEIESCFFIDCSGDGVLACYNGKIDSDFYQGEDPYERFEESLIPKNCLSSQQRQMMMNEPSLFFKVGKPTCNHTGGCPSPIGKEYRIKTDVDYCYNGYNNGCWVNPMTGMNISAGAVIDLGEEKAHQMTVEAIPGYWDFICKEVMRRLKTKEPLYGFKESDISLTPNGSYAPMLGIRETRRVCCEYMLRQKDLTGTITSATLGRNIACGSHDVDFHLYGSLKFQDVYDFNQKEIRPSGIPYDCLIPKRFNNMLVACRAYGASHIALAARRVNKDMAQLGWAAGNAVRWCLEKTPEVINVRNVDVSELQSERYTGFKQSVEYLEAEILK